MKRILRLTLAGLIILLLFTPHVIKTTVIPHLLRQGINAELNKLWNGSLTIQNIEFNYYRPIRLKGLILKDRQGREWLRIKAIELTLRGFPGRRPVLTGIVLDTPAVNLFFEDGSCRPPSPMSRDEFWAYMMGPSPYADLDTFTLRNGSVSTLSHTGKSWAWDNVHVDVTWRGPLADVRMSRFGDDGNDRINLMGKIDSGTSKVNLMVAMAHVLDRREAVALLASLDQDLLSSAEGLLTANFNISGCYNNWSNLDVFGSASLNSLRCYQDEDVDHPVLNDANMIVEMNGRKGRIASGNLDTDVWTVMLENIPLELDSISHHADIRIGGLNLRIFPNRRDNPFWAKIMHGAEAQGTINVQGHLAIPLHPNDHFYYYLQGNANLPSLTVPTWQSYLTVSNVVLQQFIVTNHIFTSDSIRFEGGGGTVIATLDVRRPPAQSRAIAQLNAVALDTIAQAFWPDSTRLRRGEVTASMDVQTAMNALTGLTAHVELFINDAELNASPLYSIMMKMVGVDPRKIQGVNDLASIFDVKWPVFTLQNTRIANKLAAFDIEPGGTLNFDTEEVDCYIVAGVFSRFHFFLLKPFANMAQTLTRVHIKGKASDPMDRLIRKAPVADLAKGTFGFITDTLKTGGELGDTVLKTLWMPFSSTTNSTTKKK